MSTAKIIALCALLLAVQCLRVREHQNFMTKYAYYTVKEAAGSQCRNNFSCDGLRTCVNGTCQGVARPPKDLSYQYDESITGGSCPEHPIFIQYQNRDYYCTGNGKCLDNGKCEDHTYTGNQKFPWYTVAEGSQSRCTNNWECDGARICHYRFCNGVARPAKNPAYVYDERFTRGKCPNSPSDRDYVHRDYYCRSSRKCSAAGRCEDLAAKSTAYVYDQRQTLNRCPFDSDPNVPVKDYFCDGLRTCSQYGFCQGKAR